MDNSIFSKRFMGMDLSGFSEGIFDDITSKYSTKEYAQQRVTRINNEAKDKGLKPRFKVIKLKSGFWGIKVVTKRKRR